MRDHIAEAVPKIREQVGTATRSSWPVGRRRLGGRGRADPPRHRRPAHLRVRRPRPAAPERRATWSWTCSPATTRRSSTSTPRAVPGQLEGRDRPRAQAQDHRPRVRRGLPGRGEEAPRPSGWRRAPFYPDVIESGGAKTKKATTIKSHHNVGGLPETLGLLLEPLRELFKDEVARLGVALGLPPRWSIATPSSGPAWACASSARSSRLRRPAARADAIFIDELPAIDRRREELVRPDQPGLHGLPAGQERRRDGRRPHLRLRRGAARRADQRLHDRRLGRAAVQLLKKVSSRIINEVRGINRVTYDVEQAAGDDRVGMRCMRIARLSRCGPRPAPQIAVARQQVCERYWPEGQASRRRAVARDLALARRPRRVPAALVATPPAQRGQAGGRTL